MDNDLKKLSVSNVCKTFRLPGNGRGDKDQLLPVLRGVSFDVREGEVVSLVGESSCGKTTLLPESFKSLVRLDSGSVMVDGAPIVSAGRDRGFVFQQASLLPWRSARQNVEFGLELQGMPKIQRVHRAGELLELVGLAQAANQYPHQLSGGMQQRVGLARALAIDPAILLMDEPFSALDAQTREVLQAELLRIHEKTAKTTLFVTHDLDEALYLSDRVIVFAAKPGRIRRIIDVPFARSHLPLAVLRADASFQSIRAEMWSLIGASPVAA